MITTIHAVRLPDDKSLFASNIEDDIYYNMYYLGNHEYGPRQITKTNEQH